MLSKLPGSLVAAFELLGWGCLLASFPDDDADRHECKVGINWLVAAAMPGGDERWVGAAAISVGIKQRLIALPAKEASKHNQG